MNSLHEKWENQITSQQTLINYLLDDIHHKEYVSNIFETVYSDTLTPQAAKMKIWHKESDEILIFLWNVSKAEFKSVNWHGKKLHCHPWLGKYTSATQEHEDFFGLLCSFSTSRPSCQYVSDWMNINIASQYSFQIISNVYVKKKYNRRVWQGPWCFGTLAGYWRMKRSQGGTGEHIEGEVYVCLYVSFRRILFCSE